jgi:NhaP-type Na+/H+ or K+/H+ antiporter
VITFSVIVGGITISFFAKKQVITGFLHSREKGIWHFWEVALRSNPIA